MLVDLPGVGSVVVQLLHVLPFDSNRKRMSVVVRHPLSGQVVVYTKGADSVIMDLSKNPKGKVLESSEVHGSFCAAVVSMFPCFVQIQVRARRSPITSRSKARSIWTVMPEMDCAHSALLKRYRLRSVFSSGMLMLRHKRFHLHEILPTLEQHSI